MRATSLRRKTTATALRRLPRTSRLSRASRRTATCLRRLPRTSRLSRRTATMFQQQDFRFDKTPEQLMLDSFESLEHVMLEWVGAGGTWSGPQLSQDLRSRSL
jgi:hypothetical protein